MASKGVKEGGRVGEEVEDRESAVFGGADKTSLVIMTKLYGGDCRTKFQYEPGA